jgi:hypothetical protein
MNLTKSFISILLLFLLSTCKIEEPVSYENGFVKSYSADYDIAVVAGFQLHDGNYLVTGFDQLQTRNGQMIKIDSIGKMIWEKPVSPLVIMIWSAFPVPGTGFVIFGINDLNSRAMNICLYDIDGNLISTSSIVTTPRNDEKTPYKLMLLSNGNYALAEGLHSERTFGMRILSPDFKLLSIHKYTSPVDLDLTYCKAMCEMPNASIAIFATVAAGNGSKKNLLFIKTDFEGKLITNHFLNDSMYGETANTVIPYKDGLLAVTAKMQGNVSGGENNNGMSVNYYGTYNDVGNLVSGMIQLKRFDNDGQLTNQKAVTGYPKNGMMNSIRATNDDGYILCGTVNQQNTYLIQSDTRIYLLKLDANLMVQWSKIISTTYPALGVDAEQTSDGGYFITAFQRAFNKRFQSLVIKTDANGNY